MGIRTLGGAAMLAVLCGVVFFAPLWVLPIAIGILSAIGVHEMLCATGIIHINKRIIVYAMLFAMLVPAWVYFGEGQSWGVVLGLLVYTMLLFVEGMTGSKEASFDKLCIAFFAGVAIPYFFSSFIRIIALGERSFEGRLLLIYPVLGAFGSDVFAYLFGRAFGKHKLAPEISPNKTVEGSIAGFVMAPIVCILYTLVLDIPMGYTMNYGSALVIGVASAFAGQLGDLSLSFIKRQTGIKDFGKIIPGHGGVLDRFDSVLFTAPLVELLMALFPIML